MIRYDYYFSCRRWETTFEW